MPLHNQLHAKRKTRLVQKLQRAILSGIVPHSGQRSRDARRSYPQLRQRLFRSRWARRVGLSRWKSQMAGKMAKRKMKAQCGTSNDECVERTEEVSVSSRERTKPKNLEPATGVCFARACVLRVDRHLSNFGRFNCLIGYRNIGIARELPTFAIEHERSLTCGWRWSIEPIEVRNVMRSEFASGSNRLCSHRLPDSENQDGGCRGPR